MIRKSNKASRRRNESNRNSRIVNIQDGTRSTTYTSGRDPGSLTAAIETSPQRASSLVLNRSGATFVFDGNEARTLFQLLSKHYDA